MKTIESKSKRFVIRTLGCKANYYDSQLIETELRKRGWEAEPLSEETSLCIVNSCTVTDEADRQSRGLAAKLARSHPQAKVVVTGCAAEVDPERLANSIGIDYVVGNQDKPRLVDLVLKALDKHSQVLTGPPREATLLGAVQGYGEITSRHPMDREWPTPEESFQAPLAQGRKRAFLKIQEGCNSFCTYCIIPYGRGPSRSLAPEAIVAQVQALVADGFKEVVITGTNVGDYGMDWAETSQVEALFERILRETELTRLRVSSLDPVEITPRLRAFMAREPRFCPHFHVSLQSPSSSVLKLMKRKYSFKDVKDCLEEIARIPAPPGGVYVGMDLITGFPGETDEEFQRGYEALKELPWTRLHVFPYSERAGTPATRLPGAVPPRKRGARAKILRDLSLQRLTREYRNLLNQCRREQKNLDQVLLQGKVKGPDQSGRWLTGYTPNYFRVQVPVTAEMQAELSLWENRIVSVRPIDLNTDSAAGEVTLLGVIA